MATRTPGWNVLAHLPPGYILTAAIDRDLHVAWAAKGGDLTDSEIAAIVGPPLPFPATIRRLRPFGDRIIYGNPLTYVGEWFL